MGNRGVLLYVDLGKLEDEPYRLSKIYDTLGQYIDDIRRQRDIIYISKMAESLDISSLDRYRAQLVDEYDRLGTLKKILDEAYDLYKECNEKFEASGQTLCNLYAETPWYETSEGKLAIGIGVLVVTAAVAIVCPAVLGATAAAVTQSVATSAIIGAATSGVMNGIASMNSGKSFYDGFASGFESGAILGAISGGLGAGISAVATGAELTVGRIVAVKAVNMISDATVDSVVYAYHSNKYDKDFTGGDIVKTWVKSAATSFAMQSVGGGKSSSKTDGGNGIISNGKGRGDVEGSVNCESGSTSLINIDEIRPKLKTEPNTAFFWSGRTDGIGGADNAANIAKSRGGVTLESTIESQNIVMPEWDFNNPSTMEAWDLASEAYAEQVSGEIRAVIGAELRTGNIWENVELPRLMKNPNVTKITTIDPKTGVEKIIFER